jgi:hypothetical protein
MVYLLSQLRLSVAWIVRYEPMGWAVGQMCNMESNFSCSEMSIERRLNNFCQKNVRFLQIPVEIAGYLGSAYPWNNSYTGQSAD